MVLRASIVAAAALVLAGPADGSRVLWQGPLFAGDAVLWGEQSDTTPSLHLWSARTGERVVFAGDTLDLGRTPAASARLVAFGRSYPGCAPQPGVACPQERDALVGPPGGSLRPLEPPTKCFSAADALAVDGGVAAYLHADCARGRTEVVVRDVLRGR